MGCPLLQSIFPPKAISRHETSTPITPRDSHKLQSGKGRVVKLILFSSFLKTIECRAGAGELSQPRKSQNPQINPIAVQELQHLLFIHVFRNISQLIQLCLRTKRTDGISCQPINKKLQFSLTKQKQKLVLT